MTQRSTNIRLMLQHCPAALDYAEAGTPYVREQFAVGTAAHDILHAIGEAGGSLAVVPKVVEHLIAKGRSGLDHEGPLPADKVFEGRDLAVRYAEAHDWHSDQVWFELGIGLADDLTTLVPYMDPRAFFHSRPDMALVTEEVHEDEYGYELLKVVDYKSSWAAGEDELDTFQRRSQAFAAKRWWESKGKTADGVKCTVVNLRTHARYSRIIWWDSPEWEDIEQDIRTMVNAANARPRRKSPGAGCVGCPFLVPCSPSTTADVPVEGYPVLRAFFDQATTRIRNDLRDSKERIEVPGGTVGWESYDKAVVRDTAAELLWNEVAADKVPKDSLAWQLAVSMLRSVLTSRSAVDKAAKFACPDGRNKLVMARRRMLIDECIDYQPASRFGVQKTREK